MTQPVAETAGTPYATDSVALAASLQGIEERVRVVSEVTEGLRPLITLAQQAPALIAVVMDSLDEVVRTAADRGVDIERGVLNGAEAALRFGATMEADKVRELDALLKSGVLAPGTLRIIGELGRALTDTAAVPPATPGVLAMVKALGQPDVQRAMGFLLTFAQRFGARLRELSAVDD